MTDFIVTITDPVQLAGITWARESYNASLPPPPEPPPDTVLGGMSERASPAGMAAPPPMPGATAAEPLEDDAAYVQHVMEQAAISYADQQLREEHRQNYEDAAQTRAAASARRAAPEERA